MKRHLIKTITVPLIAMFFSILSPLISHAIPVLGIDPDVTTVTVGDSFTLEVTVTDVIDLNSFLFDLKFDPLILSVTGISEGSFLAGTGPFPDPTTFSPGAFGVGEVSSITGDLLFGGATGSGVLASITFHADAVGSSSITLVGASLSDSGFNPISFDPVPGDVKVLPLAPVPEPASLVLLGSGLLLLAIAKKRMTG